MPVHPQVQEDRKKFVALTFDDGPDGKYTSAVMDILDEYKVKGTFFVVGQQAIKFPEVIQRMKNEGHSIGNHTFSHVNMPKQSIEEMKEQITKTDEAIKDATGETPTLFRAPYGSANAQVKETVSQMSKTLVPWSVDTRDWAGTSVAGMMGHLKKEISPGGIVLMHSFGGKNGDLNNTLQALPLIIEYLQNNGYTLVTTEVLLAAKG
ncbi:hypothetical protein SY83_10565 [Paenibacillus swuensis]|uniref:NodB homology domain-containing protein n=1 Tax=Paenibacillus swuensis TaxID=1178515 RepID=A0A172TQ11_9BACL|nr:hypothetical protein SY83_10565 [Paenibacillus swuensis]